MNIGKLSLFLYLCLSLCFLCACAVNVTTGALTPDETISSALLPDSSSSLQITEPEPGSSTDASVPGHTGSYESDLGFTLEIPDSWFRVTTDDEKTFRVESLFAAEETDNTVRFYHIASAEAGYGGTLLTIRLYEPGQAYDYLPDYELLAECEAGSFVALYPTDVQTDPEDPEVFAQHLAILQTLREDVAEGFHLS